MSTEHSTYKPNSSESDVYGSDLSDPHSQKDHKQQGYLARGQSQLYEVVSDHEGRTILLSWVAGFGLGVLLGFSLSKSGRPRRLADRVTAEGIGQKMMDRIERLLPDVLSDRLNK